LGTHQQVRDVADRTALPNDAALRIFFTLCRIRPTQGKSFMQRTILHQSIVAILVTVAAGACQYWLQGFPGEPFPLVIFPLAVLAASWVGGLAAGLGATVGCTLAYSSLAVGPATGAGTTGVSELVLPLSLLLVGVLISLGISRLRGETARARRIQADARHGLP
jgi:K+-sensing histidine kinase KdpD